MWTCGAENKNCTLVSLHMKNTVLTCSFIMLCHLKAVLWFGGSSSSKLHSWMVTIVTCFLWCNKSQSSNTCYFLVLIPLRALLIQRSSVCVGMKQLFCVVHILTTCVKEISWVYFTFLVTIHSSWTFLTSALYSMKFLCHFSWLVSVLLKALSDTVCLFLNY